MELPQERIIAAKHSSGSGGLTWSRTCNGLEVIPLSLQIPKEGLQGIRSSSVLSQRVPQQCQLDVPSEVGGQGITEGAEIFLLQPCPATLVPLPVPCSATIPIIEALLLLLLLTLSLPIIITLAILITSTN